MSSTTSLSQSGSDWTGSDHSHYLGRSFSNIDFLLNFNNQPPSSSQNLTSTQTTRQPNPLPPASTSTQNQLAQANRGVHAVLTSPQIEEYVNILKNNKLLVQRHKDAEAQQEKMVEVNLWVKVCFFFILMLFG